MKAVIIIPYFGKLPDYFDLWAYSASNKHHFDFWVITDDVSHAQRYDNIRMIPSSFAEFAMKAQAKFDFPLGLTSPRKLCDLKPCYGYIFEDALKTYQYWGYGDIDTIVGDWDVLVPLGKGYDKLYVHGHMTLLKNDPEINRLFMKPVEGFESYREILSASENRVFDEQSDGLNINLIAQAYHLNTYYDYAMADISPYAYLFKRSLYDYASVNKKDRRTKTEDVTRQIFLWHEGKLTRYALNHQGNLIMDEMRYCHFQKRPMETDGVCGAKAFLIVPNRMIPFDGEVTVDDIMKYTKNVLFYPHYYKLKWANLKKRLGGMMHACLGK